MNKPKVKPLVWIEKTPMTIVSEGVGLLPKEFFKIKTMSGPSNYCLVAPLIKREYFRSIEGAKLYAYILVRKLVLSLLDFEDGE